MLLVVPLKVRDIIKLLESNQWQHARTNGDHRTYRGPDGRITVVSDKLSDDVRPGTWRAILRQTGIKEPEK
jgi:predicted RNA binding protein YcfA (HicA-like mRNA interferase family)